ncbi:hypothetical protein [Paenibacillus sp. OSY-SE]|uniref:hypothetical protein n=1 Tax=Paenibacillus sp. OSY-SE TaxID=1196323 RepID=UPI00036B8BA3|nr:hypothetical protein [Paenibacillus sp. OSY-SE]
MKYEIINIVYPTCIDNIKDITDDNLDVDVYLNDGHRYSIVVTTPKNYLTQMDNNELCFIEAGPPDIIVERITDENIRQATESFLPHNAYWLKLYSLAGNDSGVFDINKMDEMIEQQKKQREEIFGEDY